MKLYQLFTLMCAMALVSATDVNAETPATVQSAQCPSLFKAAQVGSTELPEEYLEFVRPQREVVENEAMVRLESLRDQLATLETKYPSGFNTHTVRIRDSKRYTIAGLLRLGQERRIKHLTRKLITEFRDNYVELRRQESVLKETIDEYVAAIPENRPILQEVINEIETRRVDLLEKMGESVWDYTGIVEILMADAGLRPRATLVASAIEHTLLSDMIVNQVADDIQKNLPGLVDEKPQPASVAAQRLLHDFGIWDARSRKTLTPSLEEVDYLYRMNAIMRVAKMEKEVKVERHETRMEIMLSMANDQNVKKLLLELVSRVSGGTLRTALAPAINAASAVANERLNTGRVMEFISLADRIPNNDEGNNLLASTFTQLISSAEGVLGFIVLRQEAIEGLNRVKSSKFAQSTVWGPNGMTLTQLITKEEGKRSETGTTTTVFNGETQRSFKTLPAVVLGLTGWLIVNKGDIGWQYINSMWAWIHSILPWVN